MAEKLCVSLDYDWFPWLANVFPPGSRRPVGLGRVAQWGVLLARRQRHVSAGLWSATQ